jgi:hypothetical protein
MNNNIPAANISENETDNAPCLGLLISWQQPWKEVLVSCTRNNNHTTTQSHRHVYISILARYKVLPDVITGTPVFWQNGVLTGCHVTFPASFLSVSPRPMPRIILYTQPLFCARFTPFFRLNAPCQCTPLLNLRPHISGLMPFSCVILS